MNNSAMEVGAFANKRPARGLTNQNVESIQPCGPKRFLAVLAGFLCALLTNAHGQEFHFVTNENRITITEYLGEAAHVIVPETIALLPVAAIGNYAFANQTNLVEVTLPNTVTTIEASAFITCTNLTAVYFRGNAPDVSPGAFPNRTIAYYLPGAAGWGTELSGRPTAPWHPRLESVAALSASNGGSVGFSVRWASGGAVSIEFATNLTDAIWVPLQIRTLAGDSLRIHDAEWTNSPAGFYRAAVVNVPLGVIPSTNMTFIPPGSFTMGSPSNEPGRFDDEGPQTMVTISRGFWMSRCEVTQQEYLSVVGTNPSYFNGVKDGTNYGIDLNRPVEQVTWRDATNYCALVTLREGAANRLPTGYEYRLPTEAEWEYACRAGTTTPFYLGDVLRSGTVNFNGHFEYPPCGDSTSYCTNAAGLFLGRPVSVGSYAPNPWGLHDMIGNVSEWCRDRFGDYSGVPSVDPQGPQTGGLRISRGSSWLHPALFLRSALRDYGGTTYQGNYTGFRVVLAPIL